MENEIYDVNMTDDALVHYGVKGMKWGVRRYQNKDGSLTPAGKKPLAKDDPFDLEKDGLSLKNYERFYEKKLPAARDHVKKDFGGTDDVKRHRAWLNEAQAAFEKWYFNDDSTNAPTLKKEYDRLCYEHPEAKKYETSKSNYIYNQASSKLKRSLDEAREKNYELSWTMQRDNTENEYGALHDTYERAYNDTIYADIMKHSSDELTHWGIRGMKWGVRRYQNKDGSLTPAGKRRLQKQSDALRKEEAIIKNRKATKAKIDKLEARRKAVEDDKRELDEAKKSAKKKTDPDESTPAKKTIHDLTDDELRAVTNRMQLEKNFYDAQKSLAAANPKPVSKGKKFVDGLLNDVVVPAAKNAGRDWLEKTLKDKLGLNKEDTLSKLEKQYKKLDWQKKIQDLKKDLDPETAELTKQYNKLDLQKKIREAQKDEPDISDLVSQLNEMSDEDYGRLVRAANVKYFMEGTKGKGVKPDKGKDKKKDDDDDD